jgi:hypothetical protein
VLMGIIACLLECLTRPRPPPPGPGTHLYSIRSYLAAPECSCTCFRNCGAELAGRLHVVSACVEWWVRWRWWKQGNINGQKR